MNAESPNADPADRQSATEDLRQKFAYSTFMLLVSVAALVLSLPDVSPWIAVPLMVAALVVGGAAAFWRPPSGRRDSRVPRVALAATAYGGAVAVFLVVDDDSDVFYVGAFLLFLAAYFFTLSFIDARKARDQSATEDDA